MPMMPSVPVVFTSPVFMAPMLTPSMATPRPIVPIARMIFNPARIIRIVGFGLAR
jgi:hypothetical protein